jgi:uncharacterized protein YecE (DUF72 family)
MPLPGKSIHIGTAGWAIPRAVAACFAEQGNALERYAGRFDVVEINSTFHRPHRRSTYERWAASVPDDFRFAVKLPKKVSHELRLAETRPSLESFFADVSALGDKLGVFLLQLPPSFAFDATIARNFFKLLRTMSGVPCVCEPRHPTWFESDAHDLLCDFHIGRVAADPARVEPAEETAGWPDLRYIRLHGSPRMYYSAYDTEYLKRLTLRLHVTGVETWCIFDNTASGAACANALELKAWAHKTSI